VSPKNEDLGRITGQIEGIIKKAKLPEGVRVNLRGSVQGVRQSFKSFGIGLILSVVLVYLVLVAQFASWEDPFIILLAVPPGLAGVLLFLLATRTTLNVMSLMGVVMMVGIVVSNSILIVEFARHLDRHGQPPKEAVSAASRLRLRPVLMTSLATLLGMIPMALGLEAGSEQYAPLARAIIGGVGSVGGADGVSGAGGFPDRARTQGSRCGNRGGGMRDMKTPLMSYGCWAVVS